MGIARAQTTAENILVEFAQKNRQNYEISQ